MQPSTTPAPIRRVAVYCGSANGTNPAFLAEAQLEGLDIEPVNGTELQKIVTDILTSPASVRDRLSKIIELPQQGNVQK